MRLRSSLLTLFLVFFLQSTHAQSVSATWTTADGLNATYYAADDITSINTGLMEIEKPRLLDEYRGNKFFVGLSYTCRGRTAKCLTRNVQLEVMVDGQLPATLADGSLHGALFTFADKQQFQIGSPFEWTFSQCWKSGLREKCFPGSFTATVTASELNKIAVHKLPTSIAIAGVGELNVTFPVFRAVAANTQDKH